MKTYKQFIAEKSDGKFIAINLKGIKWKTPEGMATFPSQTPGYGIQNANGQVLSRSGDVPASWRTKKIVTQMLPYADTFKGYTWMDVIS